MVRILIALPVLALASLVVEHSGERARYSVTVRDHAGKRPIQAGADVHPGSVLQFSRTSSVAGFVGVFTLDTAGTFTTYLPMTRVKAGELIPLPRTAFLDDVLGDETFLILDCDNIIDGDVPAIAARNNTVPAGCALEKFSLNKTSANDVP